MSSAFSSDVAALRAVAHPARLDLLDLLRVHEKLTAAECARLLGTSTKSCSYHLGVLAAQGLVARTGKPSDDGRERPWRRAVDEINFSPGPGTGAAGRLRTETIQLTAQRDAELFSAYLRQEQAEPAEWQEAVTVHTRTALMSAEQLRDWGLAVEAVTREHVASAQQAPAGARPVRLAIRGFPQQIPARAVTDE